MRAASLLTCLWPGLSQLWLRGSWLGLLAAMVFSLMLNLALLASFIWPDLLDPAALLVGWFAIGGVWCLSTWRSFRRLAFQRLQTIRSSSESTTRQETEELFVQAQAEYIKGHWFEAETILNHLLSDVPGDLEARLMLASLFRHTRRIDDSRRQLRLLQRLNGAERWAVEISQEQKELATLDQQAEKAA